MFVSLVGYVTLLIIALKIVAILGRSFVRPGKNLKQYGSWAVVTGATDGIGEAIAYELARAGLNLVLVSRTPAKLETTANGLREKFPKVQIKTLPFDFSNCNSETTKQISRELADVDVGVLVNNVGESYANPEYFTALPDEKLNSLLALNIHSVTWMTRAVLPGMETRKRGLIVNISSASASLPSPLLSYYAATKAFVDEFSVSLNGELAGKGIQVQSQNPLFVATKLAKIRRATLGTPSAKQYARAAVRAFGYESLISPYWVHGIMLFVASFVPTFLGEKYVLDLHKSIRKRALDKQQKESGKTSQ
jgi:17beta-estradiol 17-dehydrogenase / very-long-chain 3-oxoacyl-CoA reductase